MTAEAYIENFARQFSMGRYEALVHGYDFPLPIYVNRVNAVAHQPSDAWSFFQALHALIRSRGFEGLTGRVVSVELPLRGRFRLWVDWLGMGGGTSPVLFKTICYNVGTLRAHRTEMFTMETRALPEIEQLLAA